MAVVAVESVADGAFAPVPAAELPDVPTVPAVPEAVPVEVDGRLDAPVAAPDAEVPVADVPLVPLVPLELSVADGVAALGDAAEVAGVLLVVALSEGDAEDGADCAFAMPARASAAEPIKSFWSSLDMVILL